MVAREFLYKRVVEEWRLVADWPYYEVSNLGRIRRIPFVDKVGVRRRYRFVSVVNGNVVLHNESRSQAGIPIGKLVLLAFVGPRPSPIHLACHKDDNRNNNRLDNFYWGTPAQNKADAYRNNRIKMSPEHRAALTAGAKRPKTAEHRRRLGESRKGKKYKPLTEQHKHNIGKGLLGHQTSAETRAKIGAANRRPRKAWNGNNS